MANRENENITQQEEKNDPQVDALTAALTTMAIGEEGKRMSEGLKHRIANYVHDLTSSGCLDKLVDILAEGHKENDKVAVYKSIIGMFASHGRFDLIQGFMLFVGVGWSVQLSDGEDGEGVVVVTNPQGVREVYAKFPRTMAMFEEVQEGNCWLGKMWFGGDLNG